MNNSVDIELEFGDDEATIESVKDFFAPFATVQLNKAEQKAIKSWDKAIEIVLTIIGTWASEKYILDPLASKAGEWLNGIKSFWEKSGFQHKVNVIIKFKQDESNFEIQLLGAHEPETLKQVWQTAKDIIELLQTQNIQIDKIRITSNTDKSLLVIGYSGNQPKYTIDLSKKAVLLIKASPHTDENEFDPEVELWLIAQLEKRLEYLKFIKEKGYDIPEAEIESLEAEIQSKKDELYL